jgi:hypothetical protein
LFVDVGQLASNSREISDERQLPAEIEIPAARALHEDVLVGERLADAARLRLGSGRHRTAGADGSPACPRRSARSEYVEA